MQRLLEIETYRMMALIALPLVQEHGPQIRQIEEKSADISRSMSEIACLAHTRATLSRLSRLSADVEGHNRAPQLPGRGNARLLCTGAAPS